MKISTVVLIVIISIPALTMVYLMLVGATFTIVHNEGDRDTKADLVITSGDTFERTPDQTLAAGGYRFIWFRPKTTGALSVACLKPNGHWRSFPLGSDTPDKFIFTFVKIDACDRLTGSTGFSL